jgi:hypothetical protein
MRFLVKISMPVEAGNAAAKKDGFGAIQSILQQQKPEAAYFLAQGGKRTGILILNLNSTLSLRRHSKAPPLSVERRGAEF